jgi:midasin
MDSDENDIPSADDLQQRPREAQVKEDLESSTGEGGQNTAGAEVVIHPDNGPLQDIEVQPDDEPPVSGDMDTLPEDDEHDLELQMSAQVHTDRTEADGERLWQRYSSLTHELSHTLCEQLRLILEPTLATRLQGDYRTGKRLNMRKIIPYIASEYTKDKIWLRRTKPSRREYQVLLSLDDSRSMADSHSVHLAYQTIALVSQALNKLEVGQLSVARFGEGVEIIHPFGDTGFSHADGTKVMRSFRFDQHKTDVAELVERSLTVLGDARQARSGSSSPDLWQLEIIISDGICQDHPRLRKLLRRALDERVMIVFLVLDSLNRPSAPAATGAPPSGRTSVMTMQTVAYKEVAGEMQIEMNRYLDTFPFEYYVVLQDVEALPDTLSEILRQWMMRVSLSEE